MMTREDMALKTRSNCAIVLVPEFEGEREESVSLQRHQSLKKCELTFRLATAFFARSHHCPTVDDGYVGTQAPVHNQTRHRTTETVRSHSSRNSMSATALSVQAAKQVRKWVESELTKTLGFCDAEIVNYVLTLDNAASLQEYIAAFFPRKDAARQFCRDLTKLRADVMAAANQPAPAAAPAPAPAPKGMLSRRSKTGPISGRGGRGGRGGGRAGGRAGGRSSAGRGGGVRSSAQQRQQTNGQRPGPVKTAFKGASRGATAKPKKVTPAITVYRGAAYAKAQKKKEKERAKAARKHEWYSCPHKEPAGNCLECGKIVCKEEGTKYCSFCRAPLDHVLSKQAQQERRQAMQATAEAAVAAGLSVSDEWKALERKERLLEWDRKQAARSHV